MAGNVVGELVVCVGVEERYVKDSGGHYYTKGPHDNKFYQRYRSVFDKVIVVARAVEGDISGMVRVCGDGVIFGEVPNYRGIWELMFRHFKVQDAVSRHVAAGDCVVGRLPGVLGAMCCEGAKKVAKPCCAEVVGDPFEAYRWVGLPMALRLLMQFVGRRRLRRLCASSDVVSYVTEWVLQQRYPPCIVPGDGRYTCSYSSVSLPPRNFGRQQAYRSKKGIDLICVAGMDQPYKGHHVLIESLALLQRHVSEKVTLYLVGDGPLRKRIERMSAEMGVRESVKFCGRLNAGIEVVNAVRKADIFVLPSLTEGLPRALIEAMAVGIPCVASNVGGCCELLTAEFLVRPGDPRALAAKLVELSRRRQEFSAIGAKLQKKAADFAESSLRGRRDVAYRKLAEAAVVGRRTSL